MKNSSSKYLIFLKRRSKVKDEGGKGEETSSREEHATFITGVDSNEVGSVGSGFQDGTVDQHVGCRGGGATRHGCGNIEERMKN